MTVMRGGDAAPVSPGKTARDSYKGDPRSRARQWGEWGAPQDGTLDDEYGRGLAIVAALADKLGHDIRAGGQTVWAEVNW